MHILRQFLFASAILGAVSASAHAQATAPPPDVQAAVGSVNQVLSAVEDFAVKTAPVTDPALWPHPAGSANGSAALSRKQSLERMLLMISSGAMAGAAIGAATSRNPKAAAIGAAVGGVAGLIYERIAASQAAQAAQAVQPAK